MTIADLADWVVEVVRAVTPLSLPRVPDVVMGIINLRGDVVPVLDTRKSLRLPAMHVRHTDHFVIVRDGELLCALHTDRAIDLTPLVGESGGGDEFNGDGNGTESTSRLAKTSLGFVQLLHPRDLLNAVDRVELSSLVSALPVSEIRGK